jgi:hypothetical protein
MTVTKLQKPIKRVKYKLSIKNRNSYYDKVQYTISEIKRKQLIEWKHNSSGALALLLPQMLYS